MFADLDDNKDGTVTLDEWCAYFTKALPADLTDEEFKIFFDSMRDTIILSRQPIKWSVFAYRTFLFMAVVQAVRGDSLFLLDLRNHSFVYAQVCVFFAYQNTHTTPIDGLVLS